MKRNKCSSLTSSDSVLSYTLIFWSAEHFRLICDDNVCLVILVVSLVHLNLA